MAENTHFSIFDEKEMINSNKSEMELKSFVYKRLKTNKHSRFSNQMNMDSGVQSSARSGSLDLEKKRSSPNASPTSAMRGHNNHNQHPQQKRRHADSYNGNREDMNSEIGDEDNPIERMICYYKKEQ